MRPRPLTNKRKVNEIYLPITRATPHNYRGERKYYVCFHFLLKETKQNKTEKKKHSFKCWHLFINHNLSSKAESEPI